jgi:hypothetical protein
MVKEVKWTFFLHVAYWSEHKLIYHYLYRHRHTGGQNTFDGPKAAHKLLSLSGLELLGRPGERVRPYAPIDFMLLIEVNQSRFVCTILFSCKARRSGSLPWRKNVVLISWDYVDYRAQPFFGNVKKFQESANKDMILMRVLLDAPWPTCG